jgi:hypothetical protein
MAASTAFLTVTREWRSACLLLDKVIVGPAIHFLYVGWWFCQPTRCQDCPEALPFGVDPLGIG